MEFKIKAYAKINIGLNVFNKEPKESKHKIQSLFCIIDYLYDEIVLKESEINWVEYYSDGRQINISNDIVTKCIRYLRQHFNIKQGYEVEIYKSIPISSGLGGSSTDGAAVMKKILELNEIPIDSLNMEEVALELGSDIPFFLYGYKMAEVALYGSYVREVKAQLPNFEIIPTDIKCNTGLIYQAFDQGNLEYKMNDYKKIIKNLPYLGNVRIYNNLEPYAFKLNPTLSQYKKKDTLLSGSGGYFIKWC